MDEDTRKIVEMAYDGTAETAFIFELAQALRELAQIRGCATLAADLLSRLTEASLPSTLSEDEKARLRTMRKLLISAVGSLLHQEMFGNDPTIQ